MPTETYPGFRWLNTKPYLGYDVDWGHPLARGLLLAAPCNEGGGPPFEYLARKASTPTATTWSPGKFGAALKFNGSTSNVSFGTVRGASARTAISVACWVNPSITTRGDVFGLWNGTLGRSWLLTSGINGTTFSWYVQQPSGTSVHADSTTYSTGTWYHVVGTYDGTNTRIYLNSVQSSTTGVSGVLTTSTDVVYLGQSGDTSTSFTGLIDAPLMWDHALTAAEVLWLFREPFAFWRGPNQRRFFAPAVGGGAVAGAAVLPATATLTPLGSAAVPGAVSLAALATLTPGGSAGVAGAAVLGASASILAGGGALGAASAVLQAAATLTPTGSAGVAGTAPLAAVATLAAAGSLTGGATALLAGQATLAAAAGVAVPAAVVLGASASIVAGGVAMVPGQGTAVLAGSATLTAALAPLYPSLLAAFHARIDATPGLLSLLPGGHFTGAARAEALANPPWAEVMEATETARDNTAGKVGEDTTLVVSLYGEDVDQLKVVKQAFEDTFRWGMDGLAVARRPFMVLYLCGPNVLQQAPVPVQDAAGLPLFEQVLRFRAMLGVS